MAMATSESRVGSRQLRLCCATTANSEQTTSSSRTSGPRDEQQPRHRRHRGKSGQQSCLSNSRMFALQSLLIWLLLAVPGNLMTVFLWSRVGRDDQLEIQRHQNVDNAPLAVNEARDEDQQSLMRLLCLRVPFPSDVLSQCREACLTSAQGQLNLPDICIQALNQTEKLNDTKTESTDYNLPCYELRSEYSGLVSALRFWCEGVLLFGLGLLGLLGNLMTVVVLSRVKRNRNFNNLLVALSVCDLLLILDLMLEMAIFTVFMEEEPEWYKLAYPLIMHPLRGVLQTSTIYMVVAVSAERYKAVCHPLARRQAYYKYIAVAVATSVSLELPRFLEFRRGENSSDFVTSDLMEDPDYIQMNSYWNELFATGALPLFALIYMNTRIYLKIRASAAFAAKTMVPAGPKSRVEAVANNNKNCRTPVNETSFSFASNQLRVCSSRLTPPRRQLSHSVSVVSDEKNSPNSSQPATPSARPVLRQCTAKSTTSSVTSRGVRKRMEKSTVILVAIVIIFVFCHTYRLVLRIYEMAYPENNTFEHFQHCSEQKRYHIPVVFYVLINFHHLFLLLNSSVNFVIYCCVGKDFRADLANILGKCVGCNNNANHIINPVIV